MIQVHSEGQPGYPVEQSGLEQLCAGGEPEPYKRAEKERKSGKAEYLVLQIAQKDHSNSGCDNQDVRLPFTGRFSGRGFILTHPQVGDDKAHDQAVTVGVEWIINCREKSRIVMEEMACVMNPDCGPHQGLQYQ